jgi:hypothetical protein
MSRTLPRKAIDLLGPTRAMRGRKISPLITRGGLGRGPHPTPSTHHSAQKKPCLLLGTASHENSKATTACLPVCPHPTGPNPSWKCGVRQILLFCGSEGPRCCDASANPYPVHSIVASLALVLRSGTFQGPMDEIHGRNQPCNARAILRAF